MSGANKLHRRLRRTGNNGSRQALIRTVADASKNIRQLGSENRRLKQKITALEKRLANQQKRGSRFASALCENRRLRKLERGIVFFMGRFIEGAIPSGKFLEDLDEQASVDELTKLYKLASDSKRYLRKRAFAVAFRLYGISVAMTSEFLGIYPRTVKKYDKRFKMFGCAGLLPPHKTPLKVNDARYKQAIFEILHAPPSDYGFNRTTWRRKDIHSALTTQGRAIGQNNIDKIIKNAGYRFLKARRVLVLVQRELEFSM